MLLNDIRVVARRLCLVGICSTLLISCGSTQLSVDLKFVSTSTKLNKPINKKKSKKKEVCTWYLFGIPLGETSSPQAVFEKLDEGAVYINHLAIWPSGWRFWRIGENSYFIAKSCWNAKGVVAQGK